MSQTAATVTRLPTVPGATGEKPAPPTLAMSSASRSKGPAPLFADQLVAVRLDDGHLGEAPRAERGITEQDHAVDLRRLARQPAFIGESGIHGGTVDEDSLAGAVERLQALPDEAILRVLVHPPGSAL